MTENTTSELALATPAENEILDPRTGELIDLDEATEETLASFRLWIQELEEQAKAAKRAIDAAIHRRMDRDASWTRQAGGEFKLVGRSPGAEPDYNVDQLVAALAGLVRAGKISPEAARAAAPEETKRKVSKAGVKALRALRDPEIDEALDNARKPPPNRTIKVERISRGA